MNYRTLKAMIELECSDVTLVRSCDPSEFCVRIKGNPDADYFTTDAEDAFATAQAMQAEVSKGLWK